MINRLLRGSNLDMFFFLSRKSRFTNLYMLDMILKRSPTVCDSLSVPDGHPPLRGGEQRQCHPFALSPSFQGVAHHTQIVNAGDRLWYLDSNCMTITPNMRLPTQSDRALTAQLPMHRRSAVPSKRAPIKRLRLMLICSPLQHMCQKTSNRHGNRDRHIA